MPPLADSLEALLRKTTREPLYVHPSLWSTSHLTALRVSGFDRNYPLEHVIGRPLARDPADADLARIFNAISKWPEGDDPKLARYLYSARSNSMRDRGDRIYAYVCHIWLESIYSDFRGLKDMERWAWK
jgi:hypothetical protein